MTASAGAPGATSGPVNVHEGRRHRERRATERSDWRGGRAGPSTSTWLFGGPASGVAGGRGGDLCRAQRTGAERSAVREHRRSSPSGRADQRAIASATALSERAIPGHGKGRLRDHAGAAGLFVAPRSGGLFAQGMEARQGRDTDRRAGARCAARQPGPAQRGAPGAAGPSRGVTPRNRPLPRRGADSRRRASTPCDATRSAVSIHAVSQPGTRS